jgi:multimeric flavodoxin WrbA
MREKILSSELFVLASPTWLGQPSSIAKRVLERMDAMLSETDDEGRPVAYNRVAGIVVTWNEDGAHHVINELAGALIDIGFTVPGQAWTYWNQGAGSGRRLPRHGGWTRLVPLHRRGGGIQPDRRRTRPSGASDLAAAIRLTRPFAGVRAYAVWLASPRGRDAFKAAKDAIPILEARGANEAWS